MTYFTGTYPLYHSTLYSNDVFKNTFIAKSNTKAYIQIEKNFDLILEYESRLSEETYKLSVSSEELKNLDKIKRINAKIDALKKIIFETTLETQNLIIVNCFNNELNSIKTLEDVKNFQYNLYNFKHVLITTNNYNFFNDFYCHYLNQKYAYEPKEEESNFVPLDNIDLSNILCVREERKMLDGNVVSWKNNYYQIINEDGSIKPIFKGTKLLVYQNVLTKVIRVKYYNHFYNTIQIEGHRQDPVKREQLRIDNQKQLEQVLKERDERVQAILMHK